MKPRWRNLMLRDDTSDNIASGVVAVSYVDPLLSTPTPTLEDILAQIAGHESDIANLTLNPTDIPIIGFGTDAPVVPITYVDPVLSPTGTIKPVNEAGTPSTIAEKVNKVLETHLPTTTTKPITTTTNNISPDIEKKIDSFFDIIDKLLGYESDSNLTNEQIILKNEDQTYKAGGIAIAGILSLLLI